MLYAHVALANGAAKNLNSQSNLEQAALHCHLPSAQDIAFKALDQAKHQKLEFVEAGKQLINRVG